MATEIITMDKATAYLFDKQNYDPVLVSIVAENLWRALTLRRSVERLRAQAYHMLGKGPGITGVNGKKGYAQKLLDEIPQGLAIMHALESATVPRLVFTAVEYSGAHRLNAANIAHGSLPHLISDLIDSTLGVDVALATKQVTKHMALLDASNGQARERGWIAGYMASLASSHRQMRRLRGAHAEPHLEFANSLQRTTGPAITMPMIAVLAATVYGPAGAP